MRALYLIVGILVGAIATVRYDRLTIDWLVESQADEVLANKLVGFHDGYTRGYTRAMGKCAYLYAGCKEETAAAQEELKALKSQCYIVEPQ
jgi:hypothetical protein